MYHVSYSSLRGADGGSPFMSYDSVTSNTERLAKCKNFTLFYSDLEADTLPQWMFITPNMSSSLSSPPPSALTNIISK